MRVSIVLILALSMITPAVLSASEGAPGGVVAIESPRLDTRGSDLEEPAADPTEICEPGVLCFKAEECDDLQFCLDFCIEGVGCGAFETGIKYPRGAGVFDPWLDVQGDEIVGPLTLNGTELVFQGVENETIVLSLASEGGLAIDGTTVCVQGDAACIGTPLSPVDCPPGEQVGTILSDGTATCDGEVAPGAVTTATIAGGAVTTDKIASGAVTDGELGTGAVSTIKIADFAVTTDKLADAAVTHPRLAPDAVDSSKIRDGSVGADELGPSAVTQPKIATGAVTSSKVLDGSLDGVDLADGAVVTGNLAVGAVTSAKVLDGSLESVDLADGAVATSKLAVGAVTSDRLASGSVGSIQLADGAVTTAKIGVDCAAGKVLEHTGTGWSCGEDDDTTYDGADFALSGQACASGEQVVGVTSGGLVVCATDATGQDTDTLGALACTSEEIARFDGSDWLCGIDQDTTYSGADFALSGQGCASGQLVSGIDASGNIACVTDQNTDTNTDTLGELSCSSSQVAKFDGAAWVCSEDADTDTTYTAGTGLALAGTMFSADTSAVQARVSSTCTSGSSIRAIDINGAVTCESDDGITSEVDPTVNDLGKTSFSCTSGQVAKFDGTAWTCAEDVDTDTDTTYTAGDALTLSGTQFSLAPCASGKVLKHDGTTWTCAEDVDTDTDTTYSAGDGLVLSGTEFALTPCTADKVLKHDGTTWTCADDVDTDTDTTYTAGDGLVLSGTEFALTGCAADEILRVLTGTAWGCSTDQDTTYTAGSGLALSGTTFSADTSAVQARVSDTCASGSSIRAIDINGAVTCESDDGITSETDPTVNDLGKTSLSCTSGQVAKFDGAAWTCAEDVDTDTTYDAGFGLALAGTIFEVDAADTQLRVSGTCASGSSIRAIGQDGTVTCESDDGITSETDPTVNALAKATLGCFDGEIAKNAGGTSWLCAEDEGLVLATTTVVSPTGDASVDGSALLNAMASQPGLASDPRVVLAEPGTYDVGTSRLDVPSGVTLLGSGAQATVITGQPHADPAGTVVALGEDATVRHLRIENTDLSAAGGIYVAGPDAVIEDVTIEVGPSDEAVGIHVDTISEEALIRDVTILARGGTNAAAIRAGANVVQIDRVHGQAREASSNFGLELFQGSVEISGSTFETLDGPGWGLRAEDFTSVISQDSTFSATNAFGGGTRTGVDTRGDLDLRHSTVHGDFQGVKADFGSVVSVLGGQISSNNDAVRTSGGTVRVDGAHLDGGVTLEDGHTFIGGSRIDGTVSNFAGPTRLRCVTSYDLDYQELDNACQPLSP